MNICVLDDNKLILIQISNLIKNIKINFKNIFLYDNHNDLNNLLMNERIDLLFIDIRLNNINGIDYVKDNKDKLGNAKIIYITGYDYAEKIFETNPFYYLKKPINEDKIRSIFAKLECTDNYITIKVNKEIKRVLINEIMYVESSARLILFHLNNGEVLKTYSTINIVKSCLTSNFVQIHKSFIVNIENIKSYKRNEIILKDNTILTISRNYANKVKQRIINYIKDSDYYVY